MSRQHARGELTENSRLGCIFIKNRIKYRCSMHWYDVLPSNWAVLFHLGTSRPGSGRLGQDENAVVMVFLDAPDNYLSPSEGDENKILSS